MERKAKRAAGSPGAGPAQPRSDGANTDEIDFSWEDDQSATRPRKPREAMPTLHDEDPLRHDPSYRHKGRRKRELMPTLPDIDPLRHDIDDEGSSTGGK